VIGHTNIFGTTPDGEGTTAEFSTNKTFTPAANGLCIVSQTGYMDIGADDYPNPRSMFFPELIDVTAGTTARDTEAGFHMSGNGEGTGSSTTGFDVIGGHTYRVATYVSQFGETVIGGDFVGITYTWNCQ
jgi:hypothetical protein